MAFRSGFSAAGCYLIDADLVSRRLGSRPDHGIDDDIDGNHVQSRIGTRREIGQNSLAVGDYQWIAHL